MTAGKAAIDPDALEVAPGIEHDRIEGWVPELASEDDLRVALEKAFDYRGDVTLTRKDGSVVEGYIFDRRTGQSLVDSCVRMLPKNSDERVTIASRDTAAGISWEAWVKRYLETTAAGETNISIEPDKLD